MALTQEAILNTLIEGKGKVKNSELLKKFTELLNCSDPEEKKQNRAFFKTFVNNVAVVKEFEGTRYIVLKKLYHHLLGGASNEENEPDYEEDGSHPKQDAHSQKAEGEAKSLSRSSSKASAAHSPIQNALERSRNVDFKPIKSLHFTVPLKPDPNLSDDKCGATKKEASTNKPFALPLRMPQVDISPRFKKPSPDSGQELQSSPQCKRKTDSVTCASGSPQLRKQFKSPKNTDEPKFSSHGPLERIEHELMVKSAAGQWNQVYGILLKDAQLTEKKDFMSGFTALHWAVKYGNVDMVDRIIEISKKSEHGVDVNSKSNGGYTPLHIAAIHSHFHLVKFLVLKYGANRNIRDNCGKKAYFYLRKDVQRDVRELLGDPKTTRQEPQQGREDVDPQKYPKNRLFPQNPVGMKKKSKARNQFMSLAEDSRERDEPVSHKQRLTSDVFH